MTSRLAAGLALIALPFFGVSAAAADETPNPTSTSAPAPATAPAPPAQPEVENGEQPHVGDENFGRHRNGDEDFERHGIFHDEEALFALGGAFLLGAGLAYVVLRRKKRAEI